MKTKLLILAIVAIGILAASAFAIIGVIIYQNMKEDPIEETVQDERILSVEKVVYKKAPSISAEYKVETYTVTNQKIDYQHTQGTEVMGNFKIVEEKSVEITEDDFEKILRYIDSLGLKNKEESKNCTGSGTYSIELTGDNYEFSGYYAPCFPPDGDLNKSPEPLQKYIEKNFFN